MSFDEPFFVKHLWMFFRKIAICGLTVIVLYKKVDSNERKGTENTILCFFDNNRSKKMRQIIEMTEYRIKIYFCLLFKCVDDSNLGKTLWLNCKMFAAQNIFSIVIGFGWCMSVSLHRPNYLRLTDYHFAHFVEKTNDSTIIRAKRFHF